MMSILNLPTEILIYEIISVLESLKDVRNFIITCKRFSDLPFDNRIFVKVWSRSNLVNICNEKIKRASKVKKYPYLEFIPRYDLPYVYPSLTQLNDINHFWEEKQMTNYSKFFYRHYSYKPLSDEEFVHDIFVNEEERNEYTVNREPDILVKIEILEKISDYVELIIPGEIVLAKTDTNIFDFTKCPIPIFCNLWEKSFKIKGAGKCKITYGILPNHHRQLVGRIEMFNGKYFSVYKGSLCRKTTYELKQQYKQAYIDKSRYYIRNVHNITI